MVSRQTMAKVYSIAATHNAVTFLEIGITVGDAVTSANMESFAAVELVPTFLTMLNIVASVIKNAHRGLNVSMELVVMLKFIHQSLYRLNNTTLLCTSLYGLACYYIYRGRVGVVYLIFMYCLPLGIHKICKQKSFHQ